MNNLLVKYAKLAVVSGVNIQKGQPLSISANVRDYEFVEEVVKQAYLAGAGFVEVKWNNDTISRLNYESVETNVLAECPDWVVERTKDEQKKGYAYLSIISSAPGNLKGINPAKINAVQIEASKKLEPYRDYQMSSKGQWCIVALPSVKWAKMVFPDLDDQTAYDKLMDAILASVHVKEDNDPVEDWKEHDATIARHCQQLNDYHFKSLHFKNSLGTDLEVGLVDKHVWAGGDEERFGQPDVRFNPNMPTEECFTMPSRNNVNGVVYSSLPLSYQGDIIDKFWLKFENGKVVDFDAKEGKEVLSSLIKTDEGSCRIGEVALISYNSPISQSGILFLNTLFDENASCHLALGRGYPMNIAGGTSMSIEELLKEGYNVSMKHVDFMFGSSDMSVVGTKEDGEKIVVFKNGNFAF